MKKCRERKRSFDFKELDYLTLTRISRILSFTFFCFLISLSSVNASDGRGSLADGNLEAVSQQRGISGKVTDMQGLPLPGVTVLVKGTTTGTITDFDGNYTIGNVPEEAVLLFSFVGMKAQEVAVAGKSTINIKLEDESIGLEEVVAIGYTVRKKGEVTGSISTVSSESIERSGNKDIAKSLSGKVPGLIVNDRGGYPGEGDMTLLIRGKSTLGNNSPLILIDGIVAGNFSYLSPQDIESLTVLKDGAAAIYGARAANGVILITTKRGKTGKPKINLSSSYTMSSFSVNPKLMNSAQYAVYQNEARERNGFAALYSEEAIAKYASGEDPLNYPNTDWLDLTFADYSPEYRTSLSVSGGNEDVNYFVSGDYMDQVGMYESGDLNFKQYQVRSNLDVKIYEDLKLGVDLSGRFGVRNEPGVPESYIYKHIYANSPTQVGVYPNGLVAWGGENGSNPYIMSSKEAGFITQTDNDLRAKFSMKWDLSNLVTEGLRIESFAGIRKMSNDIKNWYTPWTVYQLQTDGTYLESQGKSQQGDKAILRESFWKYDELMLNAVVHYDRTFGDHTVRGFAGIEQTTSDQRNFWAERKDFPTKQHYELFAGSDEGQLSYGTSAEWGRVNYFGSLSYDFAKKYFVDLTLRRDGSSNFAKGKQFGIFPGAAVSWSIGDEKFMDFTNSWLNALKIRSSWAIMGNDQISAFQFLTRYSYGGLTDVAQPNWYIFGGTRYNGYTPANVPNPDITWETADMKNIGVNFLMFDSKLSADVNYFYQKREDILITRNASVPDFTGLTLPAENLGKVDNYGLELELAWSDKIGELSYNIGANFTQAKNEVVYMDEAADVPEWRKREGHPMDSYIVYPTFGLFKDQDMVDNLTAKYENTVEGEPAYVDTDGDGEITSNDAVRSYSSNVPEIQYGIFGGLNYKGFDLNFLFQGQAQAKMLVFFDMQEGARPDFLFNERWTPENRDARYPRAFVQNDPYSANQSNNADNFQGADLWLHNASFVRLKEIELGYTFSKDLIKFGSLKVYVRGNNLLTLFSDVYDMGLDPEASGYNNFRLAQYPSLKSYSFGFNLSF
ncbi:SusC/RagA family TonB-linked outer membrane protein [Mangrovibacterium sp.]|uniref:SusC/RagA family TonB-linked outer membrane protein n=1 Tax=Mangrovibacterium sp. TaxID=1961364 RepID=UPI003563A025